MAFQLREWQAAAIERCKDLDHSVVEACPGAGKSAFSGGLAKHWLDSGVCNHVLCVVPSIAIKHGVMRQWKNTWGLKVRSALVRRSGNAFSVPWSSDATVITYHELRSDQSEDALRLWSQSGWSFSVVFDEVHHAAQLATWGNRVGAVGRELAKRVCVMTGTPFRTDGKIIELMRYAFRDGEHVANPDYQYQYRRAVEEDVCRPVAIRWIDGKVVLTHCDRGTYERNVSKVTAFEMGPAQNMFFDPNGETMKSLVQQVHADLSRLRERPEYADAAALFVCRIGIDSQGGRDEKRVHAMGRLIARITGFEPTVVCHEDKTSAALIDRFARSSDPYIVAVNMVSEGVDIPRLRKVAFCRYTESEMVFRQVVGRVLRKTLDNDPVASLVYVPAFAKMVEFGERLWDEAKGGVKDRDPNADLKCRRCGQERPCGCVPEESEFPFTPKIVGIDAHAEASSGRFDDTDVETPWIGLAEQVSRTHVTYRHWNQVHLGALLKTAIELHSSDGASVSEEQQRDNLCDRLNRRMAVLARVGYGGDYGAAWRSEIFDKHEVECLNDIRILWTHDKIQALIRDIEKRIHEAAFREPPQ